MTDPIADMLTRIRNAQAAGKAVVVVPSSKLKRILADLLVREGWLERMEVRPVAARRGSAAHDELVLSLRYRSAGVPWITSIQRISKPGRRVYVTHDALPRVRGGMGMAILSTPVGVLTHREAKQRGIGGEVLCEIY